MAGLNYGNLTALTRDKFIPILVDNIFNSNALLLKLLSNAEKLDGGKKIIVPVEYGKVASSGGSKSQGFIDYSSSTATAIADQEIISASEWEWSTAYAGIYFRGDEEHKNQGDSQVLSLLKSKMKNAEKSMKDLFGDAIFASTGGTTAGLTSLNGAGTEASANYTAIDAGGLGTADHPAGILENPVTNPQWHAPGAIDNTIVGFRRKVGNIDTYPSSTDDNKWWNSPFLSLASISSTKTTRATFNELTTTTNGVAELVKQMTRMYGACTVDNDQPDLIVTTQTMFDAYESSLQANKRWAGDSTLADAGFQTLRFKGATVVVDSHCPAGQMYFLNTKYLDFKVHSKRNFAFDPFKRQEGNDVMQARIFWMGQLTSSNCRMQGLIVGGPTSY
jgi:hypothetical protein